MAFGKVFIAFFLYFWRSFWLLFPGFAKNAAPHELTVNTSQIEGRALVKACQKASKNNGKNKKKTKTGQ